jgi:hypothetical protein
MEWPVGRHRLVNLVLAKHREQEISYDHALSSLANLVLARHPLVC